MTVSGFKEWYNEDDHDLYNYPEEAIESAWDKQQVTIESLEAKNKELQAENERLVSLLTDINDTCSAETPELQVRIEDALGI